MSRAAAPAGIERLSENGRRLSRDQRLTRILLSPSLPPSLLEQDLILRRRSDTFDSLLGFPQPLGVIGNGGGGMFGNDNENKRTAAGGPLQSLLNGAKSNRAPLYLSAATKGILPERRPSAISEANSTVSSSKSKMNG